MKKKPIEKNNMNSLLPSLDDELDVIVDTMERQQELINTMCDSIAAMEKLIRGLGKVVTKLHNDVYKTTMDVKEILN